MTVSTGDWDHVTDLAIVGSGAGAMTAALVAHDSGLNTLILEKTDLYGGSSAMSGGVLWVPNNPLMRSAGLPDSAEDALDYLCQESGPTVSHDRLRAFVDYSPEMIEYLLGHSRLRFNLHADYPDYHPEAPGARAGGRSIEPRPYDGATLGRELAYLRPLHPSEIALGRVALSLGEARQLAQGSPRGIAQLVRWCVAEFVDARARRLHRPRRLTLGNALIGRLRKSLLDRDVVLWRGISARELVLEGRAVVGVIAERGGRSLRIAVRRGVLLACGGFDHHGGLRRRFQDPRVGQGWSAGNLGNAGEGLELGLAAGATLELMDQAWWTPTLRVPGAAQGWPVIFEKALPGSLIVDQDGRRFTDEAASYSDVVQDMFVAHVARAYLIFDARFRAKYPCGPVMPGWFQPDWTMPRGILRRASSLDRLAFEIGLSPPQLCESVERFNASARRGEDPDFRRGKNIYDRYWADARCRPNPCLAPLEKPPFYAAELHPGDLGTKGGLVTDARGRVLDANGERIEGLYASGNCTASVMGKGYPGAGATLAPAMTFSYLAALIAAGRDV